jgi:hypothetical protein
MEKNCSRSCWYGCKSFEMECVNMLISKLETFIYFKMNSSQEPIDGFNSKLVDFSNFFIIKKKSIIIIKKGEK